ncbi:pyridoxal-phosphate dependent enzyme [Escherichia coli]
MRDKSKLGLSDWLTRNPCPVPRKVLDLSGGAARTVYEAAQVTPLQKMEKLSSRLDNVILVKREDRQPVRSFKLRGAYAMMAGLTEEQKA